MSAGVSDMGATLPETLTLREAPSALAALRQAFAADAAPVWRVDASPLRQLDSAAIAVLLELHRIAATARRRIEVAGAPPKLVELARLYGVDTFIGATPAAA